MRACFFALLVPTFAVECSGMIQVVVALDRFVHVFFQIWSFN
jgi:hypothetical protein